MYTEKDKFQRKLIRIDQLITTLIFITSNSIQQCYNKENSNHVDKIWIYQLNPDWLANYECLNHYMGATSLTLDN